MAASYPRGRDRSSRLAAAATPAAAGAVVDTV